MKKRIGFLVLSIILGIAFAYFAGSAMSDGFQGTPDNKDHSFQNMIFVIGALASFVGGIVAFLRFKYSK